MTVLNKRGLPATVIKVLLNRRRIRRYYRQIKIENDNRYFDNLIKDMQRDDGEMYFR